jgi:hypothetical protein
VLGVVLGAVEGIELGWADALGDALGYVFRVTLGGEDGLELG